MLLGMQSALAGLDIDQPLSTTTDKIVLSPPYLLESTLYVDQTFVRFGVENLNGRGITEIYRSTSPDSGFEVVATYSDLGQFYVAQWNLKPRTTFWYKCRIVDGAELSMFTETFQVTTFSFNYKPTLFAHGEGPNLIVVDFTDNSYNDIWYTVDRRKLGGSYETFWEFQSLDSGAVHWYDDGMLEQGTTYIYNVHMTSVNSEGTTDYYNVAIDTATTWIETPILSIDRFGDAPCGNTVPLVISYPDLSPKTELYRSLSPDGPFVLIATIANSDRSDQNYIDNGVPRRTNYYKARAVGPHAVSPFSNVISYDARSQYYAPDFSVVANPDGTADITLKDNTYADAWYRVERMRHSPTGEFEPVFYLEMSDSGQTHAFRDTTLLPGSGYTYFLTGKTTEWCVGWPGSEGEYDIAEVDIATPANDYTITGFTLVDPVTDQDIGPLLPGAYFEAGNMPNIRANTGSNVKSVIFFLNRKRRTDNGGPIFSYWPEKNGDYQPGVYEVGPYRLEATAYSEKNGGGVKGVTVYLSFDIKAPSYSITGFALVDPVTDQDIGPLTNGTVVDASLMANIRANASVNTKSVMFFLNNKRHADNGGPVFTYFSEKNGDYQPGLTVPGSYVLKATPSSLANGGGQVGQTVIIQFSVRCSACSSPSLSDDTNAQIVDLFPNPIVKESQLMINTGESKQISLQVYDQFGNTMGTSLTATTNEAGIWNLPISSLNLTRGGYILNVIIDGERHMRRIIVE